MENAAHLCNEADGPLPAAVAIDAAGEPGTMVDALRWLQSVTARLSGALTSVEVAEALAESAMEATGAHAAWIATVDAERSQLRLLLEVGYPPRAVDADCVVPLALELPACEAVRTASPVFLHSRSERRERFPLLSGARVDPDALGAVPLMLDERRVVGVIVLSFPEEHGFAEGYRSALLTLCSISAQALERARLYDEVEHHARLLDAQQEASPDGVLVVSRDGSFACNRRFLEMWGFPVHLTDVSEDVLLEYASAQLVNPASFVERVRYLYEHPDVRSRDELCFRDGRIFERFSSPVDDRHGRRHGRVWYFRDITRQRRDAMWLRFLAESGALLTRTDGECPFAAITHRAVADFADWCSIDVYESGAMRRSARAGALADPHGMLEPGSVLAREAVRTMQPQVRPRVPQQVSPAVAHAPHGLPEVGSLLVVPLISEEQVLGALTFAHHDGGPGFEPVDVTYAVTLAGRLVTAWQLNQARSRERAMQAQMLKVEDTERFEFASQLHDGPLQRLAAASMFLGYDAADPQRDHYRERGMEELQRAIMGCRALMRDLHPDLFGDGDLEQGLLRLAHRVNPGAHVDVDLPGGFAVERPDVSNMVFRIANELMMNVRRHAEGALELVRLRVTADELELGVADAGPGNCPDSSPPGHFGLTLVRYRAELLGGAMEVDSGPGGTTVSVRIPM